MKRARMKMIEVNAPKIRRDSSFSRETKGFVGKRTLLEESDLSV